MVADIMDLGGVEAGLPEIGRTASWIWPASDFEQKSPRRNYYRRERSTGTAANEQ